MPMFKESDDEDYAWLGNVPQLREWLDERQIKSMAEYNYNLINKDFLDRSENDDDRRSLLISLSRAGERCRSEIEQARQKCERDLLAQLNTDQLNTVEQGLQILIGTL